MSSKIYNTPVLKYPPEWTKYISLYIYYSLAVPIQILISIPFALFRLLVIIYVKTFARDKKEYGNILNSWATMFADDQFTTNSTNFSVVSILELEGKLTLEKLRSVMKKTLAMQIEGSNPPIDRYTKLRQYPQSVMGYWFWKSEQNFNLDEHLKVVQFKDLTSDTSFDMETAAKLHGQFTNRTFPEYRSPWLITLIDNVPKSTTKEIPKTLLVLKIHHSLADGISTLKLIVEGLGQTKINTSESTRRVEKSSVLHRLQHFLNASVNLLPKIVGCFVDYHLLKQMTLNHPWRHNKSSNKNVSSFPQFSKEIPVEMLKLQFDPSSASVSPSAVIITAITESVRKFWKRIGQNYNNVFLISTLPQPMHPSFPRNHFSAGTVTMPNFGENFLCALKHANTLYMSQRDDDIHHLSFHFGNNLYSCLPKSLRFAIQPLWPFVVTSSNVAGNNVEFSIDDVPCKSFSLSVGMGNSAPGVTFTIFSYKKLVRFCVMAKENMLTKKESQNLVNLITEQIVNMNKKLLNPNKTS